MRVYEGSEKYIFISYAHADSNIVIPIINSLTNKGFRIWYDAGIEAGTEWPETVAQHLADSQVVLLFISRYALASQNCVREINYAISERKTILTIYLEDVNLSPGMKMQLGTTQAMFFNRFNNIEAFTNELSYSNIIFYCKEGSQNRPIQNNTPKYTTSTQYSSKPSYTPINVAPKNNINDFIIEGTILKRYTGKDSIVTIPNSVDMIASRAFHSCYSIVSINFPRGIRYIDEGAFINCTSLSSITIPSSISFISDSAFYGCESLKSVTIPNTIDSIGKFAFWKCTALESIQIPNSVKKIGKWAFMDCKSLKDIKLPEHLTKIAEKTFSNCTSLKSIDLPKKITSIESRAFDDCSLLENIELPNTLQTIGESAFSDCAKLKNITIPNGVSKIGAYAFSRCPFESITIPSSVVSLGESAFLSCPNLTSVTLSKYAPFLKLSFWDKLKRSNEKDKLRNIFGYMLDKIKFIYN